MNIFDNGRVPDRLSRSRTKRRTHVGVDQIHRDAFISDDHKLNGLRRIRTELNTIKLLCFIGPLQVYTREHSFGTDRSTINCNRNLFYQSLFHAQSHSPRGHQAIVIVVLMIDLFLRLNFFGSARHVLSALIVIGLSPWKNRERRYRIDY